MSYYFQALPFRDHIYVISSPCCPRGQHSSLSSLLFFSFFVIFFLYFSFHLLSISHFFIPTLLCYSCSPMLFLLSYPISVLLCYAIPHLLCYFCFPMLFFFFIISYSLCHSFALSLSFSCALFVIPAKAGIQKQKILSIKLKNLRFSILPISLYENKKKDE